ncbi:hypothetical protein BC833DRAFT_596813 [Globomyces pollinis-pini]|nr:hypothetical protein BC833DRAFT_596813 [Globomyces pollinis-pini]
MEDMSIIQALLKLQRVNTKFSVLVLIQLVNLFSYILMTSYQNYSESWGNDRNFLAINGPINLCYVIHSAVNCLFIEHVRVILKLRSQISSTAMSTHHNSSNISSINYPVKPTNDSSLPSVKRELPTSIPPTQGNPKVNRYVNPSSLMPKID